MSKDEETKPDTLTEVPPVETGSDGIEEEQETIKHVCGIYIITKLDGGVHIQGMGLETGSERLPTPLDIIQMCAAVESEMLSNMVTAKINSLLEDRKNNRIIPGKFRK